MRAAVDKRDADTSYRIVAAWTWYWLLRQGVFGESMAEQSMPIERMIEFEAGAPVEAVLMVRALALNIGIDEPLPDQFTRLIELCDSLGAERPMIRALIEPVAQVMLGAMDEAHVAFQQSLRAPDPWVRATVGLLGGLAAENAGMVDAAERWFESVIRRFRRLGDRWGQMMALNGLGGIRSMRGDIDHAVSLHTEAWQVEAELGPLANPTMTMSRLAEQYYRLGDLDRARRQQESALATALEQGQQAISAAIRCRLAIVLKESGDVAGARAHLVAAYATLANRPDEEGDPMVNWVAVSEVFVLVAEGDLVTARVVGRRAFDSACKQQIVYVNDAQSVADVGEAFAAIEAASGDLTLAARLLGASAVIGGAQDIGSPDVRAVIGMFGPAELEVLATARKMPVDEARALLSEHASGTP